MHLGHVSPVIIHIGLSLLWGTPLALSHRQLNHDEAGLLLFPKLWLGSGTELPLIDLVNALLHSRPASPHVLCDGDVLAVV